MVQKKLVPKRRFAGFDYEWNTYTLSDITDVYDGTHQTPKYVKKGVMFLSVENIKTLHSDKFISQEAFKEEFRNYPEKDDVLMTRIGDIGTANVVKTDNYIAYYVSLALLKTKDVCPYFLVANISSTSVQRNLWKRTLHIAFPKKINKNEIEKVEINIPKKIEQQKIGQFFKQLDEMIATQQRKVEKTKALKSAYLAEMFPAEGKRVPKRRFAGSTGEWEECKLGEAVQITMGQSPNSENYTDNPSDHILVQGNADMKNNRVFPRVWTTQITKKADKGDLILSVRAPVGDVGKNDYDVVLGRGVAGIKGNEFIFQLLIKMKENEYWTNLSTGSTFESINSNDIKEALVLIPNDEEQQKIGEFFKQLDDNITNAECKLDKLKSMKQAYLQEMFV